MWNRFPSFIFKPSSSSVDRGRFFSSSDSRKRRNTTYGIWTAAVAIAVVGASYAAVPLYRVFCNATGYGGAVKITDKVKEEKSHPLIPVTVHFACDVNGTLPWSFTPLQKVMQVIPGEPALAFYLATNHSKEPIVGVATYNVIPMNAGKYFNKIQCFCFDEQRLKPKESIDLPVFFTIDPEFLTDPNMKGETITLSYTFFKSLET